LPNGLGCERGGELSHSCRGFKALDFLVLFDQAKRTLIDVTVGRGFKALDLLVLFHQGKRTTITALMASERQAYWQLVKCSQAVIFWFFCIKSLAVADSQPGEVTCVAIAS
jgi:hypothetical protein